MKILFLCMLALLGGQRGAGLYEHGYVAIGAGRIHQMSVPAGTLIVVIECENYTDHLQFTNCMEGPPTHCLPRRPNQKVGVPESLIHVNYAFIPLSIDTNAWVPRSNRHENSTYTCRRIQVGCRKFDENQDGQVDLLDWAIRMVRFTRGDWR